MNKQHYQLIQGHLKDDLLFLDLLHTCFKEIGNNVLGRVYAWLNCSMDQDSLRLH